ncbi:alpha/beta hydrolase [Microbacterium sp. SD291]|uniref:alpha/beta hydrolase n=1 Tax=Microbacterium sp. SD291 TaxID=2782007 RepID=UPI001A96A235|nr:alpha/beta hydrolase family protein [Microbacterium sp. SD291]MBO0981024.1 alpha/beta fold hydrolase [Microbacterium sp. SD291]
MLLNVIEREPEGPDRGRTAVLLHGLMGSAESWWRVAPLLADRGFRVLALDLPGHGLSPRDPHLTIDSAAASVVETVRSRASEGPIAAIGHSYGASVLAAAAHELQPELAVYVDAGLALSGGQDRETLIARYERDRRARTRGHLRKTRPYYSETDATVEARAAERFDPATSASISCGPDHSWRPAPGSIVVRADPSVWVTDDAARGFEESGAVIRSIPGAAHTVWYSHFAEFTASVPEMFAAR